MPAESFAIDAYYASVHAPEWLNSAAMVVVSGTNGAGTQSAVYFQFARAGQPIGAPALSAAGGRVILSFESFGACVDLLRNESPVYCAYAWGVPDTFARIGTSAEAPGEGE